MMKKEYYKPTVKVVQLRHRTHLLQVSEKPQTLSGHQKTGSESSDTWYDLQ